eukprot:412681-Prorocentrum_minimum.AAC.1
MGGTPVSLGVSRAWGPWEYPRLGMRGSRLRTKRPTTAQPDIREEDNHTREGRTRSVLMYACPEEPDTKRASCSHLPMRPVVTTAVAAAARGINAEAAWRHKAAMLWAAFCCVVSRVVYPLGRRWGQRKTQHALH